MKTYLTTLDLRTHYMAWFESSLRYGIIHWGGTFVQILKPIITIQKLALRTVCGVGKYHPSRELFEYLDVLSFDQIYKYSILIFTKKNMTLFRRFKTIRQNRSADNYFLFIPFLRKDTSRKQCFFNVLNFLIGILTN